MTSNDLLQEALNAASSRGHSVGGFFPAGSRGELRATCHRCKREVTTYPRPLPNEYPVAGEAVALNCES